MNKPIIGITTGRYNQWTAKNFIQTVSIGCSKPYMDSVLQSNGAPLLLPRTDDIDVISSVMKKIDALLLSGGGDVISLAYGEEPHSTAKYQDPIRDKMEFEAAKIAVKQKLPILAICRGIQSLNVALGGTLIQDVPTQVKGAIQHYSYPMETALTHTIDIKKGSLLAKVLGTTGIAVTSWHHQAVKDVGKGLQINCKSCDGVIEGLESDKGLPILAVQCHPEVCSKDFPVFQKLFDWLVKEAG